MPVNLLERSAQAPQLQLGGGADRPPETLVKIVASGELPEREGFGLDQQALKAETTNQFSEITNNSLSDTAERGLEIVDEYNSSNNEPSNKQAA